MEKAATIYLDEEYRKKIEDLALKLKKQGVYGLFNKDGSVNRSALVRYLIDSVIKSK